ncbi:site-specific integrase [Isoptericola sp. b490]|uniref:site-specific integrase n=1 Tax=Actinotalea lenta TaxID=3064654 RepID=UPI002713D757|nr:site-specific integrase [Isoptericola sp. b490]MDO8122323.1 site-specific integrase [Isoptericola sp. b490]
MSRRRAKLPPGITVRCGCRSDAIDRATGEVRRKPLGSRCPRLSEAGHGSYGFRISAGFNEHGRQREVRKSGFATLKEAQEARASEVVALAAKGYLPDPGVTVAEFLKTWLEQDAHLAALRPSTRSEYSRYAHKYLLPLIGRHKLGRLAAKDVREMLDAMSRAGASESTRRLTLATLRCALTAAEHAGLISSNPADAVKTPKPSGRGGTALWSPEQFDTFIAAIQEERLRPLFEVTVRLGLRRGEVCGLRWEDVDLDDRVVTVRRNLVVVGGRVVEGAPKTKSGTDREVPFGRHVGAVFEAWRTTQGIERDAWGEAWTDSGRVFTREDGTDLRPDHIGKLFTRLARRAGLPPMRFHDQRHLSASVMISAGVPIEVVSKLLGHSSVAVTSSVYSHLLRPAGFDAAARSDAFWDASRAVAGADTHT